MSSDFMRSLRAQYTSLIDRLLAVGEHDQARAIAEIAVQHGVWSDVRQRPADFEPTLPSRPFYDPAGFWFVPYLEERCSIIRDELLSTGDGRGDAFSLVEEPLVGKGRWDEVVFYEDGVRMERPASMFPKTADILSRIPEAIHGGGVVMCSRLAPGTHIVPHCGSTNRKLRVHLGLKIPEGASIRVGDERVGWQEGRCLVFDDSFEHEVWNTASEPRVVLLFDIAHPDLASAEPAATHDGASAFERMVKDFLVTRGIVGVERDPISDELTVIPDELTSRTITRHMKDHNVTRVQIAHGAVVID